MRIFSRTIKAAVDIFTMLLEITFDKVPHLALPAIPDVYRGKKDSTGCC